MIHLGDLFDVLPTLAADSIDAVVTDPPYGIGFMGREWDTFKPEAAEKLRERGMAWTKKRPDNPNLNGRKRQPGTSPSAIEYDYTTRRGCCAFKSGRRDGAIEVSPRIQARCVCRRLRGTAQPSPHDVRIRGCRVRGARLLRVAVRLRVPEELQPRRRQGHGAETGARADCARVEALQGIDQGVP
jgi:hypothetical protein